MRKLDAVMTSVILIAVLAATGCAGVSDDRLRRRTRAATPYSRSANDEAANVWRIAA